MNSARVTGVSPFHGLVPPHERIIKIGTYGCLAIDNATAVPSSACTSSTVVSTSVGWSCTLGIETAIRPAPNPALPVCTNSEVLLLPGLKLEASRGRCSPRLSDYSGVYSLRTQTLDYQWYGLSSPTDVGKGRTLHVVKSIGSL